MPPGLASRNYFVDEAGTPEIWGRRKNDLLIGRGGSTNFIYWKRLWDAGKVRCVVDLDDTSRRPDGEIYTADNPLIGEIDPRIKKGWKS